MVFPPSQRTGLIGTTDEVYAESDPVAGVLDPHTKAVDPQNGVYHYSPASRCGG